jgi:hypothetical protein
MSEKAEKKLSEAMENLVHLQKEVKEKEVQLESETKEKAKVSLEKALKKLHEKIKKIEEIIPELELKSKEESLFHLQEEVDHARTRSFLKKLASGDSKSAARVVDQGRELLRLQETRLMIEGREDEIKATLRLVVKEQPTGWTENADILKRYLLWRFGNLEIILQDTPQYKMSREFAETWLGLENILPFLKLDLSKLTAAIAEGKLIDKDGNVITLEELYEKRERTIGEPKVVVRENDAVGKKPVLTVKPQLLTMPVSELVNETLLTNAEINPLINAGFHILGMICGMSGEALMTIRGIGPARARKILDAVCELSYPQSVDR